VRLLVYGDLFLAITIFVLKLHHGYFGQSEGILSKIVFALCGHILETTREKG